MRMLYPKDYFKDNPIEPKVPVELDKEAIKTQIKSMVAENPKSYEEIIKQLQSSMFITNDEAYNIIKEVDTEFRATEEKVEDIKEII